MNSCGRIAFDTGTSRLFWSVPADVEQGDLMILANLPYRCGTPFGWSRIDSIVDRTTSLVRRAMPGDVGVTWTIRVDGAPLGATDIPVWLVLREVYHGTHYDERQIPIEVPLERELDMPSSREPDRHMETISSDD